MIREDANRVFIDKPYFVVVEAKRTAVVDQTDSTAQLLAQIKSLSIHWYASFLRTLLIKVVLLEEQVL